jgi:oxalate decarboxylase/phosphoglucose isomerase-like protein (cupin superfamily)
MNIISTSSSYYPSKNIPLEAYNTLIIDYIKGFTSGKLTFENVEADNTVKGLDRKIQTFYKNQIIYLESSDLSDYDYIWKQLSDYPFVIGITKGQKSDHKPHYHAEAECYYVISGKALTLCDSKYVELQKGDYFYIPGNTIHNTPITSEEGFSVLYWYPNNHTFNSFKYYWKDNVEDKNVKNAFKSVDTIRKEFLNLNFI